MAESRALRFAYRSADALLNTLGVSSDLERKYVFGGASQGSFTLPGSSNELRSFSKWSMDKAIRSGYEANEAAYACVNAIARPASSVPWRVSEFTGDTRTEAATEKARFEHEKKGVPNSQLGEWMEDCHKRSLRGFGRERKAILNPLPDDPIGRVLEKPNPIYTREEFIERAFQHLYLGGNTVWSMVRGSVEGERGNGTPIQLWPLMVNSVEIKADGMLPKLYRYRQTNGEVRDFDPRDILHFRLPDPSDPLWGISPLMAAAKAVDTDVMAARWQLTSFANRGIPDMLFAFDKEFGSGQKGREDFEYTKRTVQDQFENEARRSLVIGNSARVQQLSLTPAEMDFIRSRGFTRTSVASVFDVFPQVIKIMEGFSISGIDDIMRQHWLQTVIPALFKFQSVINMALVPQFASRNVSERFVWFDTSNVDVLVQDFMEKMRAAKILHTMGIPVAELNRRFNLGLDTDNILGSDMGFFPAGVITVEQALAGEGSHTSGSGNTDTAPEGGDNPINPNEPPVEDVIPDDPGEGIPDTVLSDDLEDIEQRVFANGNLDPHEGRSRWTEDEVCAALEDESVEDYDILKGADYFIVSLYTNIPIHLAAKFDALSDGAADQVSTLRFYHGDAKQEDRDWLLERAGRWGY